MFWFCTSRSPTRANLNPEGIASDATNMCTYIFCRLCIMCVQIV